MDDQFNQLGYKIKNADLSSIPKKEGGIALWHFDTDFDLKIQNGGRIFKRLLSTEKTEIKQVNSDSLLDFDKDFLRLKNTHTLIGISVTSSSLSLFNGEQMGLKVQSLWVKDYRKKFYCFYGITIQQFR